MKVRKFLWLPTVILIACFSLPISCSGNGKNAQQNSTEAIAEQVWTFAQTRPDGFTLDISSMSEPREGVAVSYAATQGSHSRAQLGSVVSHALQHEGYVGGWLDVTDSLYYFDSTRLFPEDSIGAAIRFGKVNGQHSAFLLSTMTDIPMEGRVAQIVERGRLLVGTTGDYRPLSFREPDEGRYWGFGIEVAERIAQCLGVDIVYVPTSWPTLSADVQADPQTFDFAIGGITITEARCEKMLMSDGYLANGKTILCRAEDAHRFHSIRDIDRSEVRVMVNPAGLNEKFARDSLPHATLLIHERNEEIPTLVAEGKADVMITEVTEAPWYVQNDARLAAPLIHQPFTHGEIGVLMRRGQDDLLGVVNGLIRRMKADGSLRQLHEKYDLVYAYE